MAVLELQYLHEIGRLRVNADTVIEDLRHRIGLMVSETAFAHVVVAAHKQTWTTDPFDRLIAAQSAVEHVGLITADVHMRSHVSHAIWE